MSYSKNPDGSIEFSMDQTVLKTAHGNGPKRFHLPGDDYTTLCKRDTRRSGKPWQEKTYAMVYTHYTLCETCEKYL